MLAAVRNSLKPSMARTFATPAARAYKHTLPSLPYAYNVGFQFRDDMLHLVSVLFKHIAEMIPLTGTRTVHL